MNNEELEKIKKRHPIINLLDRAFEEEISVTTWDLHTQGRNYFMTKCRVAYTNIISSIAPELTVNEIGKLINRNHSSISWQRKKFEDFIQFDKSFQSMYERVYNKFNQLKREKENGLD
jgi:hypothetical protein